MRFTAADDMVDTKFLCRTTASADCSVMAENLGRRPSSPLTDTLVRHRRPLRAGFATTTSIFAAVLTDRLRVGLAIPAFILKLCLAVGLVVAAGTLACHSGICPVAASLLLVYARFALVLAAIPPGSVAAELVQGLHQAAWPCASLAGRIGHSRAPPCAVRPRPVFPHRAPGPPGSLSQETAPPVA